MERVEPILEYVALSREYLPVAQDYMASNENDSEEITRLKGQNILFPFHSRYPRFLIREIFLTGATAGGDTNRAYVLTGNLTGLTNEPKVYGEPARFEIDFAKGNGNKYHASGSLDHRGEQPRDSLWIAAKNFGLGNIKLTKSGGFPRNLSAGKSDISLDGLFVDDDINLDIELITSPVRFIFADSASSRVTKIVHEMFSRFEKLNITIGLHGVIDDVRFKLASNIDKVLSQRLKEIFAQDIRKARKKIEDYVRAEIGKHQRDTAKLSSDKMKSLNAEIQKVRGSG